VVAGHPDLVQVVEGGVPALGEAADLPEPHPDRVAPGEEAISHVLGECRHHDGVLTDQVHRERAVVWRRRMREGMLGSRVGEVPVRRRDRDPAGVQRRDELPSCLAHAKLGLEVAHDVHAP